MHWKFDYICENIDPAMIKRIAELNDDAIKITIAGLVCSIAGGLKYVPQKAYSIAVARALIGEGLSQSDVIKISGVKTATYYRLKKEHKCEKPILAN